MHTATFDRGAIGCVGPTSHPLADWSRRFCRHKSLYARLGRRSGWCKVSHPGWQCSVYNSMDDWASAFGSRATTAERSAESETTFQVWKADATARHTLTHNRRLKISCRVSFPVDDEEGIAATRESPAVFLCASFHVGPPPVFQVPRTTRSKLLFAQRSADFPFHSRSLFVISFTHV